MSPFELNHWRKRFEYYNTQSDTITRALSQANKSLELGDIESAKKAIDFAKMINEQLSSIFFSTLEAKFSNHPYTIKKKGT